MVRHYRIFSVDKLWTAGDAHHWHIQARILAAGAGRRLRIDFAGTVDPDIVGDHDKADRAVGGLVDGAADRNARIRGVDQASNVPCWLVACVGKVYPGRQ